MRTEMPSEKLNGKDEMKGTIHDVILRNQSVEYSSVSSVDILRFRAALWALENSRQSVAVVHL